MVALMAPIVVARRFAASPRARCPEVAWSR
jgi:hypothetical protein